MRTNHLSCFDCTDGFSWIAGAAHENSDGKVEPQTDGPGARKSESNHTVAGKTNWF